MVEFIYDADCPNVEAARGQLRRAFERVGASPEWQEWDREKDDAPAYARAYGSPTVLVGGRDVAGVQPSADAACCRVYKRKDGSLKGVPSVDEIVAALSRSSTDA
jgi:mercuric ion transport protein